MSELADGDIKRKLDKLIKETENAKTNIALIQMKKRIQAQLLDEERRLANGMIMQQQMAEQAREEIEKMRKQYVDKVKKNNYIDMQRRQSKNKLQETLGKQEKEKVQETYDRMKKEDLKAMEEKAKKKQRLGEQQRQLLDDKLQAKERRREEEKLADMKIISQRREDLNKNAHMVATKAKQIEIRKNRQDLAFAKLEANENRRKDLKAKQEAVSLQRAQETIKRELITKQKNLAEKQAHSNAMLKAGLSAQVLYKNHLKKRKADQQKTEAERIIKANKDELIRRKNNEKMQYEKNLLHADFLKQHMMERQLLANAKCREETEEAKRLIEEEQKSFMCLGKYKEKMLEETRAAGVPDNYLTVYNRKASHLLKTENPCLNLFPENYISTRNIIRPIYFPI